VFSPERRALSLGLLVAVTLFATDGMGVVPALPTAVAELNGLPLFGWAFSAFTLAMMVGTVSGGLLADARGPRAPMALGLGTFAAGLALAGAARDMRVFLSGRGLQGFGGGVILASAYVAIARGYPDSLRPRMMALFATVWVVPAMVGPSAAGALVQWVSWRYVFWGLVPLVSGTALVVLPALTRFRVRRPVPGWARLGWVCVAAAGASLVLVAPMASVLAAWAPWVSAGIGSGAALRALAALLPAGILRVAPVLPAGIITRVILAFSFFGTEALVPLGAGALRGQGPLMAGLALSTGTLAWIAAAWAQERWDARTGPRSRPLRVRIGSALLAVGIGVLALGLLAPLPFAWVPIGWAIAGGGTGFAWQTNSLICLAEAPMGREGEVSGQLQLAEALATAVGAGLGGTLLSFLGLRGALPQQAYGAVFALTWSVALCGVALAGRLKRLDDPSPDSCLMPR